MISNTLEIIERLQQNTIHIAKAVAMVIYHEPERLEAVKNARNMTELQQALGVPHTLFIDDAWLWVQERYYPKEDK